MTKIQQIQNILGVKGDGIWGAKSQAALDAEIKPPAPAGDDSVDARSELNIATLHRKLQPIARAFIKKLAENGINAKIISGTRTYAEQDELYMQGRTRPGNIVTKATAGHSNHNFGLALDIGLFKDGKYLEESPLYKAASVYGKELGLSWGGDWKFSDEPHYELKPAWATLMSENEMLAELRERHDEGRDVYA